MWESTRVCKYGACDFLLRKKRLRHSFRECRSFLLYRRPCDKSSSHG